jgi:hypothetical protein
VHIVDIVGLVAAVLDIAAFSAFLLRVVFRLPLDEPSGAMQAKLGCLGCLIGGVGTILTGLWGGYYVVQYFWSEYFRMLRNGGFQ